MESVKQNDPPMPGIPRIEALTISALRPYPGNAKIHSKDQIAQIAESMNAFGFIVPIVVDAKCIVIAGHGRLKAAKRLGLTTIPVIRAEHLTEAKIRAYRLADNKIGENAKWDEGLLRIELNGILDLDVDFNLELTGFDTGEIDIHLGLEEPQQTEVVPEPERDLPPTNRIGDLWIVGDHRLQCGNCLDTTCWDSLMSGERAQMVFTDPPYNVPIVGNVSGLGRHKHREFAMASGEMTDVEFTCFLRATFEFLVAYTCDNTIHYVCMDWRHMRETLQAADLVFDKQMNLCVWNKTNAGMGTFYRSQHEMIAVFKSGAGPHINNFGLGERGRHRSNVWTYPGANTFRAGRDKDLAAHPTVKPVAMVRDAIFDCSKRGGIILDPFAGSGTTLVAAARAGRRGFGMEIDPHYADLILQRLEEETGLPAIHADTGLSLTELKAERAKEVHDVQG